MSREIYVGNSPVHFNEEKVSGETVILNGEEFNLINNYDQMDPFFMTVVSSTDHWMFISSSGGLSAGRKNAENSLFPYYSDDKITSSSDLVGSKTIIRAIMDERVMLWEPFSGCLSPFYETTRNLYKNLFGSKIVFEEINHDLKLTYRYSWQFSERFGFVKKSELINRGSEDCQIEILDGIQNILPYGVSSMLQALRSNLVNGYKRNLLDERSSLAVFSLSSMIVDKAEPSEALKATTVWSTGLETKDILVCNNQVNSFRKGRPIHGEKDMKGVSGSFFLHSEVLLGADQNRDWFIVAEINQDRADVSWLQEKLTSTEYDLKANLLQDMADTSEELRNLVAKADGLQLTEDKMSTGRHISNVMFNIMRGGIFDEDYHVQIQDFLAYLEEINSEVYQRHQDSFVGNETLTYPQLLEESSKTGDLDLLRISLEYLPLTFSRRHGDPSRPWNKFNIELKYPDGSKKRSYEGNWRDIFQNWEALAYSFPDFMSGMISKFLNATTIDGYNPYRITRKGIDWEIIEPDDPWSYIGYWGDHQIIYLQKLLECAYRHDSSAFDQWLNDPLFVYANVPYRIKPYKEILKDHQDTIDFDLEQQEEIDKKVDHLGGDGKLVFNNGRLLKATMVEKLLVTLLSKLSNFVPEGGIWLNTQRPEWNDANNALVGNGVSMVTLYYLRRYCHFLSNLLSSSSVENFSLHAEVFELFNVISDTFNANEKNLSRSFSDEDRKQVVDTLGSAGEAYRNQAYAGFDGTKQNLDATKLIGFLNQTNRFIDHSIRANKRVDGLFHSYNLLQFDQDELKIDHLYEMLEGQVAVLSSGFLSGKESLEVLNALKSSKLFREDQYSYYLYPNRDIPHFLDKNELPKEFVEKSRLIQKLKSDENTHLISFDGSGGCYFHGEVHNAKDVVSRLNELTDYQELVATEKDQILDVFEEMFDHKSFTGRSGTFFAYEGLGSIYWHMVSKLLYATQENIYIHADELDEEDKGALIQHYYEIRAGIGINKSPQLYGAFPTDPYSHTPFHKGAQQPGMTGQVKEDVLNRWAELGVTIEDGMIAFKPKFLNKGEFLKTGGKFEYYDLNNELQTLELTKNQLAFTYCQVPIVYESSDNQRIVVQLLNTQVEMGGHILTTELSGKIFSRTNHVQKVHVYLNY